MHMRSACVHVCVCVCVCVFQAVTFIPAEDEKGREAIAKWTVGFCQALRAHLQEDADLRAELAKCQPKWTKEEIEMLATAQHRCAAVCASCGS